MSWKKMVSLAIAIPIVLAGAQPAFADNGATDDPAAPTTNSQDQNETGDAPGVETESGSETDDETGEGVDPEAPNGGEAENPTPGNETPRTEAPQPEVPPTSKPKPKAEAKKPASKPTNAQAATPVESLTVSGYCVSPRVSLLKAR
ncbi:hypothetical protein G7066_09890 [Leucobacter coleopterorum]|uniref:Uncharacterized protein n=1 Tax=Leucobacter coleopterorum TaxID=2714933 RepID=A0ABX6K160_9MICO|nr:hypothetical protein [Leucobacter coleopterorum]QIM18825.1 hypothetical protein G7066_09890 [Leucobacter coleopterorum]